MSRSKHTDVRRYATNRVMSRLVFRVHVGGCHGSENEDECERLGEDTRLDALLDERHVLAPRDRREGSDN